MMWECVKLSSALKWTTFRVSVLNHKFYLLKIRWEESWAIFHLHVEWGQLNEVVAFSWKTGWRWNVQDGFTSHIWHLVAR